MDPPPLLPSQPTTTTTTQLNHPDSATSSPRTHHTTTTSDDPLPPVPNAKLRFMCSYGGHIIPRPHDKSLCYVGGDTRMVALDRHSSLTSLSSRLSRTLFHGRSFTLKYQLPNEDLDSLISVATDEDLDNMFEEYDRITCSVSSSSSSKAGRIRLFLFLAKPETAASMGSLLDDAKSETWFVDALNGTGFDLPRGLSDSATMDCLVEIDDEGEDGVVHIDSRPELDSDNNKGKNNNAHNVVSIMPDSPLVETNSSFESSSSSPMMSNLPPIKVRIEGGGGDQMVGLDEQFLQMKVAQPPPPLPTGVGGGVQVVGVDEQFLHMNVAQPQPLGTVIGGGVQEVGLDEQFLHMNVGMPPLPTVIGGGGGAVVSGGGASAAAGFDDERLDQGAPTGLRKPPLPLQPVLRKVVDACGLLSPDSVASDSSIASATLSKHAVYQEPTHLATSEIRTPAFPIEPKSNTPDPSSQQLHDSAYMLPPQQIQQQQQQQQQLQQQQQQQQQQQFVYTNQHYIQHPVTGQQMPISSYYQMYAPPPSQQQHHDHHQMDQQYPMYFHPVTQTMPSNSTVGLSAVYNEPNPSIYLTKTGTPEMPRNANRNPAMATPLPVQVSSNQFHQQYMATVPQMHHHPSQPMAANYGFEYPHQTHEQVYYAQHPAAPMPSQYQTMSPATAAFLSQAAAQQLPLDTTQQIRNTQPL